MPRLSFALLAIPVAVLAEMAVWRDLEPDGFAAVVYTANVAGLLAVGALAGWPGGAAFVPAFLLAAAVEEQWVYEPPVPDGCDPFCSSPGVAFWGLPLELLVIALGSAGRGVVKRVRRRAA